MLFKKLLILFVLKSFGFVISVNESKQFQDIENILRIVNSNFGLNFKQVMKETKNIDDRLCINQTNQIVTDIINFKTYALKFIDSWGKIPPGLLMGNLRQIGSFDECLSISETINDNPNIGIIKGKHCMISFPTKKIMDLLNDTKKLKQVRNMEMDVPEGYGQGLGMGICLPEPCSLNLLDNTVKDIIENNFDLKINFSLIDGQCIEYNELYTEFDVMDWIAIVFFSVIAIVMFLSTAYDYITRKSNGLAPQKQLFISFSIITNSEKLFSTKKTNSPNVVECLNGMRCLSMLWIMYDHSFMFSGQLTNVNMVEMLDFVRAFASMILMQGTVAVDTFFFLSGFLLMWAVCKEMDKTKGKLNIFMMYLHRYIRLTPVVAVTILFVTSFMRHIGSGPFWKNTQDVFTKPCQDNWWTTLLYVQNYVNIDRPCLPHTWYLAVDTQLFLLSPLILIPLYKWGKKFTPIVIVLAALSIGCVFAISLKYGYGLGLMGGGRTMSDLNFVHLIYSATHARYSPWLVGILLAYGMYKTKNQTIRMHILITLFGWLISIGTMLAVIFGPYYRLQKNADPYTDIEAAFYGALHRVSWSVAIAWMVFACQAGYGGLINSILSWTIWQPFGRLTYSMYIVHFTLQYIINGNKKVESYFSNFEILSRFYSDFGISLTITIITVLAFELPILGLEKLLFASKSKK